MKMMLAGAACALAAAVPQHPDPSPQQWRGVPLPFLGKTWHDLAGASSTRQLQHSDLPGPGYHGGTDSMDMHAQCPDDLELPCDYDGDCPPHCICCFCVQAGNSIAVCEERGPERTRASHPMIISGEQHVQTRK